MSEFVLFVILELAPDNRRCNKHPGGPAAKMRRVRHYHIHVVGTRTHPVDVNAYSSMHCSPGLGGNLIRGRRRNGMG